MSAEPPSNTGTFPSPGAAERDRELAMAQEIANLGSFTWHLGTGRLRWSDQLYAIFGVDPGTPTDLEAFDARIHPEDLPRLHACRRRIVEQGSTDPWTGRIVRPDGEVRHVRLAARAFQDPDEVVVVGIMEDVTERRVLEAQAAHARKMEALSRLAGHVAHDFNNLLLVILANAAMLAEESPSPELEEIFDAVDVAKDLTRRLLAFGHSAPVDPSPVDLAEAVREASPRLEAALAPGQRLTIDAAGSVVALVPTKVLEQLLVALVLNASEAMAVDGRVAIAVDAADVTPQTGVDLAPGRYARVRVTDDGPGMDPDTLDMATEPFFTTKEPGQGAGLGLSMVYGMVRLVGGALAIDSSPEGGTTVTLWFRSHATATPTPRPPGPEGAPPTDGRRTLLVLEDDPAVLRTIDVVLRRAGYDVHTTADPDEALAVAAGLDRLDLVVSDVVTPGGGGERLVRELRDQGRRFDVLFITGFAPRDTALDGPVLLKPFRPEDLLSRIREILGSPS